MNNVNKELPKALTIEDLKNRVGKPVFVIAATEEFKNKTAWYVLSKINEYKYKADNKNHGYIEFTDCNCINFGNAQFFRFFDTEVTALELKEILDLEEKEKKKTGYERVGKGETYSTINSLKEVAKFIDDEFLENYTEKRFEATNYFNDEKLAENIARAEKLKYQLRRYAALNGGIPSQKDWQNQRCNKYFIWYGCNENKIYSFEINLGRDFGQIYFKDIEACKKAIEIFKYELIWYFTEFEEQLY